MSHTPNLLKIFTLKCNFQWIYVYTGIRFQELERKLKLDNCKIKMLVSYLITPYD